MAFWMGLVLEGLLWAAPVAGQEPAPSPSPAESAPEAVPLKPSSKRPGSKSADRKHAPVQPAPAALRADLKALRENNIFSPKLTRDERDRRDKAKRSSAETASGSDSKKGRSSVVEVAPRPPAVTGIIFNQKNRDYQALVEDRNEKNKILSGPKFVQAGDELLGFVVEKVEKDQVVLRQGAATRALRIGDSLPDAGLKISPGPSSTSAKAPAPEAKPVDEEAQKKVIEELRGRYKKKRDVLED